MARIAGVDLPLNKNIEVSLTYIYGIGSTLSKKILERTQIDPFTKTKDLTEKEVVDIRDALKDYSIEGELRKDITLSIKRLQETGTYRGTRHRKNLPARGQRTKTNSRTRRSGRVTVGSGRRKEEKT